MHLDLKQRRLTEGLNIALSSTPVTLQPLPSGNQEITSGLFEVLTAYLTEVGRLLWEAIGRECKRVNAPTPEKNQVTWVITVPAIWTDQARLLMREAALAAKLIDDTKFSSRVKICLEPEGAALSCFYELFKTNRDLKNLCFLVVDLGGGTADITTQRVVEWDTSRQHVHLEEVVPPYGGPWGGDLVTEGMEALLEPLFSPQDWVRYKEVTYTRLHFLHNILNPIKNAFELPEVSEDEDSSHTATLGDSDTCSIDVSSIGQPNPKALWKASCEYSEDTRAVMIPLSAIQKLYDEKILDPVRDHIQAKVSELAGSQRPSMMILVGGLSCNPYVCDMMKIFCESDLNMEFYHSEDQADAAMSVVKGAVLYGKDDTSMGARKALTTLEFTPKPPEMCTTFDQTFSQISYADIQSSVEKIHGAVRKFSRLLDGKAGILPELPSIEGEEVLVGVHCKLIWQVFRYLEEKRDETFSEFSEELLFQNFGKLFRSSRTLKRAYLRLCSDIHKLLKDCWDVQPRLQIHHQTIGKEVSFREHVHTLFLFKKTPLQFCRIVFPSIIVEDDSSVVHHALVAT
jgi:hypothetical protein